jgi:hypothetical protein
MRVEFRAGDFDLTKLTKPPLSQRRDARRKANRAARVARRANRG